MRVEITDKTRKTIEEFTRRMLKDLTAISRDHPGIQLRLKEVAKEKGITLKVTYDPDFETLFPVERFDRDEYSLQAKRAEKLAEKWSTRSVKEIAHSLAFIENEARLAGKSYPRTSVVLCSRLAQVMGQTINIAGEFIDQGLPADTVEPFVRKTITEKIPGWEKLINRCLDKEIYRWVGVSLLITNSDLPHDFIMNALTYAKNMPQLIETECLRGEVPENTLHEMLRHEDPMVFLPAAIGHWQADRKGRTDITRDESWRQAIIRSFDEDGGANHDEYWVGEILSKDPSLALEWLKRKFGQQQKVLPYRIVEIAKDAIKGLDQKQRGEVLQALFPDHGVGEIIIELIGDNSDLYSQLLENKGLERYHLYPLENPTSKGWKDKALLALEVNYTEENIAHAVFGSSWSFSGPESEYWGDWIQKLAQLQNDTDQRIVRVGTRAAELALKNQETARVQEEKEAVYGW